MRITSDIPSTYPVRRQEIRGPQWQLRGPQAKERDATMSTRQIVETSALPDPALLEGLPSSERLAWVTYLYALARDKGRPAHLRTHAVALYCPFAKRSEFPAGRRFCVNVYVGCAHGCAYCYARNYIPHAACGRRKEDFARHVEDDLAELTRLRLFGTPLHISNSTDPFQGPLESAYGDTLHLMRLVAANRAIFSIITFLTKNPLLAAREEYLRALSALQPCQVEVSLAFDDEAARELYEPGAPSIESRKEGILRLRETGIPVSLRIDPLFPREPLPKPFWPSPLLKDFGVERTQTLGEIELLISFAAGTGCQKVIVSALKLPAGRWASHTLKESFRALYAAPFGGKPRTRSFAWRLPDDYVKDVLVGEVRALGEQHGVSVVSCWDNLINTR